MKGMLRNYNSGDEQAHHTPSKKAPLPDERIHHRMWIGVPELSAATFRQAGRAPFGFRSCTNIKRESFGPLPCLGKRGYGPICCLTSTQLRPSIRASLL